MISLGFDAQKGLIAPCRVGLPLVLHHQIEKSNIIHGYL
jgi:hypothetical protein